MIRHEISNYASFNSEVSEQITDTEFDRSRANSRETAMMPKSDLPDLEAMQFDELWLIHEELTKILSDRILAEKRELEKRLAKLNQAEIAGEADDVGPSPVDAPSRRKYPKVLPKYYNPLLPSETWSGRGKRPRWLVAALKAGHKLEEFKINESQGTEDEKVAMEDPP